VAGTLFRHGLLGSAEPGQHRLKPRHRPLHGVQRRGDARVGPAACIKPAGDLVDVVRQAPGQAEQSRELGDERSRGRIPAALLGRQVLKQALCSRADTRQSARGTRWRQRRCSALRAATGLAGFNACPGACRSADALTSASSEDEGVMPQTGRTFSACGPFCPWVVSNSTFWFSSSDL
jgi:hypothetical protein